VDSEVHGRNAMKTQRLVVAQTLMNGGERVVKP
jgi:hypothetical protein